MGNLIIDRVIGAIAGYFGHWLARETARRAAVILTFGALVVVGLWTGSMLSRLVDNAQLSRDIAACGLYIVTGAAFWRLLRPRQGE